MTSDELKERNKKRKPAIVAERERRIWAWVLEGRTTAWIAEQEDVKPPTISRIKRRVIDRIKQDELPANVHEVRTIQIQKVRRIQAEGWDAWERSKKNKHRSKQRQQPIVGQGQQAANMTLTTMEDAVEQRDGNPAFLDRVMSAIEIENRLTGAAMPIKIAPTMPDGQSPYVPESADARRARLNELLAMAATRAQRAITSGPVIDVMPTEASAP